MTLKIRREETNLEILARIVKAAAKTYGCSMTIDFHDGERRVEFIGDAAFKTLIAETVQRYFRPALERG